METKIGAALLSLAGQSLSSEEKFLFREINPLGFCFFNRNIENQNQIYRLTQEISSLLGRDDVIFAVDQEGGRVQRLHEPEFCLMPANKPSDDFIQKFLLKPHAKRLNTMQHLSAKI